jgi:hypothetical protein
MNRQEKKKLTLSPESHSDLKAILKYFKGIRRPDTKTPEELKEIGAHAATLANVAGGACWFKNSTGGDYCQPYPPLECTQRGGTPVAGNCPHFFAAIGAATRLSKLLSEKRKNRTLRGSRNYRGNRWNQTPICSISCGLRMLSN